MILYFVRNLYCKIFTKKNFILNNLYCYIVKNTLITCEVEKEFQINNFLKLAFKKLTSMSQNR